MSKRTVGGLRLATGVWLFEIELVAWGEAGVGVSCQECSGIGGQGAEHVIHGGVGSTAAVQVKLLSFLYDMRVTAHGESIADDFG